MQDQTSISNQFVPSKEFNDFIRDFFLTGSARDFLEVQGALTDSFIELNLGNSKSTVKSDPKTIQSVMYMTNMQSQLIVHLSDYYCNTKNNSQLLIQKP